MSSDSEAALAQWCPTGTLPVDMPLVWQSLAPWRWYTQPTFEHFDRVPTDDARLLFVGNHTLMGVLDAPLLFAELYKQRGLVLRSLGDRLHFRIPVWRRLMLRYGVVEGTRAHCRHIMHAGEPMLVFPGGGREVAKRKGEKYKLIWKQRSGFAKLAIECGYTIVPFAAYGAEEAYEILYDANDFLDTRVGRWLKNTGARTEVIMPLVRGIGPTMIPRRVPYRFVFGEPITTAGFDHEADDDVMAIREATRLSVRHELDRLLALHDGA